MRKNKMKKIFGILVVAILVVTIGVFQVASLGIPQAAKNIGDVFTSGDLKYKVTSSSPAEVAVTGLSDVTSTAATIPNEVQDSGRNKYSVTSISFSAFSGRGLKSIVIPQNVETIDKNAFSGCEKLTDVTIKNEVAAESQLTTIGESAFHSSGITSVVIPQSVATIGKTAFAYCNKLTDVTIKNEVGAESQLTTIDAYAFAWSVLESIDIPQSVIEIAGYAFRSCSKLADVRIKNEGASSSKLQTIGNDAFSYSGLTSIVIPQNVETIDKNAFSGCEKLTGVTIENEVGAVSALTTIGASAFGNSGLTSIVIPQSVTTIGEDAFNSCAALTNVTITNTEKETSRLTTIGKKAFAFSGLQSIDIPQSVTTIGEIAFTYCADLSVLVFSNATSVPTFGNKLFSSVGKDIKAYVPFEQKEAYKTALEKETVLEGYEKAFTVLGYGELVLPESVLNNAEIGTDGYSQSIAAAGGVEGEVTHEIVKGALPDGLSMDDKGNITGTATKIETATFTVTAKVANELAQLEYSAEKEYTINVTDTIAPVITVVNETVTIEINGGTDEEKFLELAGASATDNSKEDAAITTDFNTAVKQDKLGNGIIVTITATDGSGNTSKKEITVNVVDTTPEPTTEEPTTEEPTIVTEKTTEVATTEGTGVETGDTLVTPIFFTIALFSVLFILASRKKEKELQG